MADQMKRHQGEAFKEQSRMHHAYVVASLTSTRGEESQNFRGFKNRPGTRKNMPAAQLMVLRTIAATSIMLHRPLPSSPPCT